MPQSVRAIITFVGDDGAPVDPGYGIPGISGGRPDNSLPPGYGGGQVGNQLPVHIGGGPIYLPVFPFDPTKPVEPDEPVVDPGPIRPGRRFVAKWLACSGLILVPDNSLPDTAQPK
jgi:hypothetical protein